jgi:membrane associated rhomboid family serine protease
VNPKPPTPWTTLALIAVNLAAAFASLVDPTLVDRFGFSPDRPRLVEAAASLFVHANTLHLLGNMVFLAAVGPLVEEAVGWWRTLALYLAGGLAGVATHAALLGPLGANQTLVGASACIAACIAYTSVRYFSAPVPLAPRLRVPTWSVALLWLALQVIGGYVVIGEQTSGVAYWAHLGGFLAGLAIAALFRAPSHAAIDAQAGAFRQAAARGPGAQLAAAEAALRRAPGDFGALARKAAAHQALGDREEEIETLVQLLDLAPDDQLPGFVGRLTDLAGLARVPSLRRTLLAERCKLKWPETARALLRSVVEGPDDDPQRPQALLSLALLSEESPARAMLADLRERYPAHPATDLARARGLLE